MLPIWTLKLGSMAVTVASTAGFWHYVTEHIHPVRAPLKPKVVLQVVDTTTSTTNDTATPDPMQPPATTPPVIVKKVVVIQQTQQQVQSSAALGASWVANKTGQKPVTFNSTS